jgi:hypothetical protein
VSFVRFNATDERNSTDGIADYVLEHLTATPERSDMRAAAADRDAAELFRQFSALSRRRVLNVNDAIVVDKLEAEYGAGSTIHSLFYPVLESLVEGLTLFAPHLTIWAPRA